ncbi:MAG: dienelactone hydrolase family protein [Acidimicrobiia bacterium]|nr:dienelactone hydrolase family protein [Acidimicrobiia bacterium]
MRISLSTGHPAELVAPVGARKGLVVIPDIMGLRPLFDDLVERLASETGWAVCAPDLYVGQTELDLEGRLAAAKDLDDRTVLGDAVAAADACAVDQVGCIGFCMGGMYTLKAVATGRFHRVGAFYGMITVPEQWRGAGQGEPLDALAVGDASTAMAVIGTADTYTPPEEVARLQAAGVAVVSYRDAEHGFVHDPDRPAHRPDDAADAWSRVIDWLSSS